MYCEGSQAKRNVTVSNYQSLSSALPFHIEPFVSLYLSTIAFTWLSFHSPEPSRLNSRNVIGRPDAHILHLVHNTSCWCDVSLEHRSGYWLCDAGSDTAWDLWENTGNFRFLWECGCVCMCLFFFLHVFSASEADDQAIPLLWPLKPTMGVLC